MCVSPARSSYGRCDRRMDDDVIVVRAMLSSSGRCDRRRLWVVLGVQHALSFRPDHLEPGPPETENKTAITTTR